MGIDVFGGPHRLTIACRPAIREHLLALSADDRYARFSSALSDAGVAGYAGRIAIDQDLCFGEFVAAGVLASFIHLTLRGAVAELGASVLRPWRQQGYACRLFATALEAAAASGVREVHLASGHPVARHICRGLGYRVREGQTYPRARVCLCTTAEEVSALDRLALPPNRDRQIISRLVDRGRNLTADRA